MRENGRKGWAIKACTSPAVNASLATPTCGLSMAPRRRAFSQEGTFRGRHELKAELSARRIQWCIVTPIWCLAVQVQVQTSVEIEAKAKAKVKGRAQLVLCCSLGC